MSDVERRQTRQRAWSIAACAAAFLAGGPLIADRFEAQKAEEAYRADAFALAESLTGRADDVRHVSFTGRASGGAVLETVSYALDQGAQFGLKGVAVRDRDSRVLSGLAGFTSQTLGVAVEEKSELDCLAEAVYYEARSESPRGQMAVAEVVMNRVRSPHFPQTVCDVVFQGQYRTTGCQFTFTCDGSKRFAPRGEAWDRARAVALHVALGLNKPVTNKATHYHTDYVNPYWSAGMVETAEIGTHIFYRFPQTNAEWKKARIALAAQDQQRATLFAVDADAPKNADDLAAAALVKISADADSLAGVVPAAPAADARAL